MNIFSIFLLLSLATLSTSLSAATSVSYSGDTLPQRSLPSWERVIPNNNDATLFAEDPNLATEMLDYESKDDYLIQLEQASGTLNYQFVSNPDDYNGENCIVCHALRPPSDYALLRQSINHWPISYIQNPTTINNSDGVTITARVRALSSQANIGLSIDNGAVGEILFVDLKSAISSRLLLRSLYDAPFETLTSYKATLSNYFADFNINDFHIFRMVLKENQVRVYIDCTLILDTTALVSSSTHQVRFGTPSNHSSNVAQNVEWDYVRYETGDLGTGSCTNPSSATITVNLPSPQPIGKEITFHVEGGGGDASGYEYAFYRLGPDTNGMWVMMQAYSPNQEYLILPNDSQYNGLHYLAGLVRSIDSGEFYDAMDVIPYVISEPIQAVKLTTSLTTPQAVNTVITYAAEVVASDPAIIEYAFVRNGPDTNGQWIIMQPYSENSTFVYQPTTGEIGLNHIATIVRTVTSTSNYEAYDYIEIEIVDQP